jgi:hypothetical protein
VDKLEKIDSHLECIGTKELRDHNYNISTNNVKTNYNSKNIVTNTGE